MHSRWITFQELLPALPLPLPALAHGGELRRPLLPPGGGGGGGGRMKDKESEELATWEPSSSRGVLVPKP